ncbi:XamI family restriction endonuclease [Massilia sp. RP-1-19]|uniref:XamI family restriction endonuclease n=1 Tax=Massilia polaris TaxID=2728846 RepID=A0A848HKJ5_9BURK|nr:XamI family restriction endonuclease [Massilia polaris]NML60659.1 XamI family restriction endonuclease [Massilia polaris]
MVTSHLAALKIYHAEQAEIAKNVYVQSRAPSDDATDWSLVLRAARKQITAALRASMFLIDVPAALVESGEHMLVFRHITAPPISQDQFSLVCPGWRKATERPHGSRIKLDEAQFIAAAFEERRSRPLTPWVDAERRPLKREVRRLLWTIAPLIASQQIQTIQRTRAASAQERAITTMLANKGWMREPSSLLDTRAALPARHFMHKTRYATATSSPQEVDIALGLNSTVVLAMECKVSNDQTNSVKRVNDVLKKSNAWKTHWGSFVKTAALLQGVIAPKDVARLIDDGVEVFWSHDLSSLEEFIDTHS